MGTNYVPVRTDLFLYSYEVDTMLGLQNNLVTLNNSKFDDYVDLIYLIELEIKYTTDITRSTSYLDLHIDNDSKGRVRAKLKDKRDHINFT